MPAVTTHSNVNSINIEIKAKTIADLEGSFWAGYRPVSIHHRSLKSLPTWSIRLHVKGDRIVSVPIVPISSPYNIRTHYGGKTAN